MRWDVMSISYRTFRTLDSMIMIGDSIGSIAKILVKAPNNHKVHNRIFYTEVEKEATHFSGFFGQVVVFSGFFGRSHERATILFPHERDLRYLVGKNIGG